VEDDVIAAIALGAAITPGCLLTITGDWRLSTRPTACIWDRKIWKPPI
jgi:hypothetical protein